MEQEKWDFYSFTEKLATEKSIELLGKEENSGANASLP